MSEQHCRAGESAPSDDAELADSGAAEAMLPDLHDVCLERDALISAIDADQARAVIAEILGVLNSAVEAEGPAAEHLLNRVAELAFPIEQALLEVEASPPLLDPTYMAFWSRIAGDNLQAPSV